MEYASAEKVPDNDIEVVVNGAQIVSRYGQKYEIVIMANALMTIPGRLACRIKCILCDTKATHSYSVETRSGVTRSEKLQMATLLSMAFKSLCKGHNDISIDGDVLKEADWDDLDEEYDDPA